MSAQVITSLIDTIKYSYMFNKNDNQDPTDMILISAFFIFITYLFTNASLHQQVTERLQYRRYNCVILEGKRCFRMTDYNSRSDQLFSNRFKAIWYYLNKTERNNSNNNNNNNNSKNSKKKNHIYRIKELAESSNIYDEQGDPYNSNRSNRNINQHKKPLDMYVVHQRDQFVLHDEIFCKVSFKNDNVDASTSSSSTPSVKSKIETINLEIFSYTKSLDDIKSFIDQISTEFMSEIHNTRLNKKFIYTLLGKNTSCRHDDEQITNKYSDWEECEFVSSRRFDNLFFEDKDNVIAKIRFFHENRAWYQKEGHPWTFGLGLSGPPGTGKTSIIKCIANMLDRHLIVIPLNKIKTQREFSQYYFESRYNVNNTADTINFNNKIIVFEDIDCMTDIVKQREPSSYKNVEKQETNQILKKIVKTIKDPDVDLLWDCNKREDELTLSYLLNIIDGLRETPGRIIIITSNNYASLDTALVRPGRIDYTLKMNNASKTIIQEMFSHYYGEPISNYCKTELVPDFVFSPAEIVNIKLGSAGPEQFIEKLLGCEKRN